MLSTDPFLEFIQSGCKSKNNFIMPTSIVSEIKDAFSIKNVAKFVENRENFLFSLV